MEHKAGDYILVHYPPDLRVLYRIVGLMPKDGWGVPRYDIHLAVEGDITCPADIKGIRPTRIISDTDLDRRLKRGGGWRKLSPLEQLAMCADEGK